MANVSEVAARLEALKAQQDNAVARVSYDGRTAECAAPGRLRKPSLSRVSEPPGAIRS